MNEPLIFGNMIAQLSKDFRYGGSSLRRVPATVKLVLGQNEFGKPMWPEYFSEALGEMVRFGSFAEFVETSPPKGLGATIRDLRHLCSDDREAEDLIDEAVRRPNGLHAVDNINSNRPDGTSRTQALRRLRDHRPDLHKRVLANELSPHAAMIEAGFRKRAFSVPDDPEAAAQALLRRFGEDGIETLIATLRASLRRKAA